VDQNGDVLGVTTFRLRGTVNLAASRSAAPERSAEAREALAEKMTPDAIAEAQRLAREWKPKTWEELKVGLETESR